MLGSVYVLEFREDGDLGVVRKCEVWLIYEVGKEWGKGKFIG